MSPPILGPESDSSTGWIVLCSDLNRHPGSEFRIRFPTIDNSPLFTRLLNSANCFYKDVNQLEGSGFALGLDLLPFDTPLADEYKRYFTGACPVLASVND